MADDAPSEEVIAKTKTYLGKVISRPKLSSKYLARPPFRYLHDVFTNVIAASGFGEGLYDATEADPEGEWDKDAKVAFLNKMIYCVGFALSVKVPASADKIVYGQAADKTNIFLQMLAKAALSKKVDSAAAVARVLAGDVPGKGKGKSKAKSKSKSKAKGKAKAKSKGKAKAKAAEPDGRRGRDDPEERPAREAKAKAKGKAKAKAKSKDVGRPRGEVGNETNRDDREPKRERPSSGARRPPPSSRPDGGSGGIGSGGGRRGVAVIRDDGSDSGDAAAFVVQEANTGDRGRGSSGTTGAGGGALTEDLRAAQDRLAGGGGSGNKAGQAAPQRHTDTEKVAREVGKLQDSIQVLCQAANPLGKLIDYMQEDLDSMEAETASWHRESASHTESLAEELRITEESLEPLHAKLSELDEAIAAQVAKINATKATIISNDGKIQRLTETLVVR